MGSCIIRLCDVTGLLGVREIGRLFTVEVITASVSEEFEVPRFDGKHGALFIAAFIHGAIVFPVQVRAFEHYAAAVSTFVTLAPAEFQLRTHIVLPEVDQVKSAELAYAFL